MSWYAWVDASLAGSVNLELDTPNIPANLEIGEPLFTANLEIGRPITHCHTKKGIAMAIP